MTLACQPTVELAVLSIWRQCTKVRPLGRPPSGAPTQLLPNPRPSLAGPESTTVPAHDHHPSSPPPARADQHTIDVADDLDCDRLCLGIDGRLPLNRQEPGWKRGPAAGGRLSSDAVRDPAGEVGLGRLRSRAGHQLSCPSVWAAGESARRAATGRPWSGWFPNTHPTPHTTHIVSRTPNATQGAGRVLGNRETPLPPARKTRS